MEVLATAKNFAALPRVGQLNRWPCTTALFQFETPSGHLPLTLRQVFKYLLIHFVFQYAWLLIYSSRRHVLPERTTKRYNESIY